MENILVLVSIIIISIGLLGTFLPFLPGLGFSFLGLLLYQYGTDSNIPNYYIIIFGILTLLSFLLNYLLPIKITKKYGGSRLGNIGGFLGTLIGIFLPTPMGFLIGMLLGVFIGEIIYDRSNPQRALSSTKGAFIGFLYGTGFSFLINIAIFTIVILDILKN